jgi:hypothetical protein
MDGGGHLKCFIISFVVQTIVKEPSKWPTHQILNVIVLFLVIVFKV